MTMNMPASNFATLGNGCCNTTNWKNETTRIMGNRSMKPSRSERNDCFRGAVIVGELLSMPLQWLSQDPEKDADERSDARGVYITDHHVGIPIQRSYATNRMTERVCDGVSWHRGLVHQSRGVQVLHPRHSKLP